MMNNTITNLIATATAVRAGQIVDGELNPIHLTIATTGYRIQSQTLHIPDRFGIFSCGPPRIQVHEGAVIVSFVMYKAAMIANSVPFFVFFKWTKLPNSGRVAVFLVVIDFAASVFMLAVACRGEIGCEDMSGMIGS